MNNINEVLLLAKQKGIYNGEIKIPIVKGILRLEKIEYRVLQWEEKPNLDSIVKR
jgi:hypothetical protein